jgi:hypothetical protein
MPKTTTRGAEDHDGKGTQPLFSSDNKLVVPQKTRLVGTVTPGKNYLLLESTAAKVYSIPYVREMEEARSLSAVF